MGKRERSQGWKIAGKEKGEGQGLLMRKVYEKAADIYFSDLATGPVKGLRVSNRRFFCGTV